MGPVALHTCPFASPLSQVRARLGPGGYCRRSGNGVPRLACLRPAAWLKGGPSMAHLHQHQLKTLTGRTTQDFLRNGLARQAREEAERSRQGTSRGAHDASHDDRDQAGARRAPAYAVSLFPLRCKGSKHRPRHRAKVTIPVNVTKTSRAAGWRSPWSPRRRHHQCFW